MNCKNCNKTLNQGAKFCINCGAKVIISRLTFKSVFKEFLETFFCWDNKFLKTLVTLTISPEKVVMPYLDGVRKRFMQPFSFLIISLTLYGFYMFYAKEHMVELMNHINDSMQSSFQKTPTPNYESVEMSQSLNEFAFKYFNLITFISIPFLAFINFKIFKKINFVEHIVALAYVQATYLYGFVLLFFLGLMVGVNIVTIYTISMIYMMAYHMYYYKRLFNLSWIKIIWKTILFFLFLLLMYLLIGILGFVVGLLIKIVF